MKTKSISKHGKLSSKTAKSVIILAVLTAISAIVYFQISSQKTSAADENLVNPSPSPQPQVQINAPSEALIGEELRFQVSDFFTFGDIVIEDIISDGQEFIQTSPAKAAMFRVTDRFGTTNDKMDTFIKKEKTDEVSCKGVKGGTRLTFLLSDAMKNAGSGITRHDQGILTGGGAFAPASNVPAEGEIVFYVKINDAFDFQGNDKEMFVDKLDLLHNCVTISGDIYQNTDTKEPKPFGKRCTSSS